MTPAPETRRQRHALQVMLAGTIGAGGTLALIWLNATNSPTADTSVMIWPLAASGAIMVAGAAWYVGLDIRQRVRQRRHD